MNSIEFMVFEVRYKLKFQFITGIYYSCGKLLNFVSADFFVS